MSTSIDERVVEMQFDNKQFEKDVETTLNSLDKLNDSLKLEGAEEGLKNLSNYSQGFDLGDIADSIDDIAGRFSAFGVAGLETIRLLTDAVWDFATNMAEALVIDPIAEGWSKYNVTNKNTITLMNQADETLEEAEHHMEKLQWYADVTSFNMNAMSSALSTFTTAGVDTDTAVKAIMGIGNSVTYAGQSAQDAAGTFAVYSKAMSQGYLSLRQWQQLSNQGVVSAKMKWQFLDAAEAIGTLKKKADGLWVTADGLEVAFDNFDQTLSAHKGKWLTADVLTSVFGDMGGNFADNLAEATLKWQEENDAVLTLSESMDMFGDKQDEMGQKYLESATLARNFSDAVDAVKDAVSSIYSGIFKSIFGDIEKATELWTRFSDLLNGFITGPLSKLQVKVEKLAEKNFFTNIFDGLMTFSEKIWMYIQPIKSAFAQVFESDLAKDFIGTLSDAAQAFNDWAHGFAPSSKTISRLYDIATGFFNLLHMIGDTIGWLRDLLKPFWEMLKMGADIFLDLAAAVGRLSTPLRKFWESMLDSWFISSPFWDQQVEGNWLKRGFTVIYENVKAFVEKIGTEGFEFADIVDFFGGAAGGIVGAFSELIHQLTGWDNTEFNEKAKAFAETVRTKILDTFEKVKEFLGITPETTFLDLFSKALEALGKVIDFVAGQIEKYWPTIKNGIKGFFSKEDAEELSQTAEKVEKASITITDVLTAIGKAFEWLKTKIVEFFGGKITLDSVIARFKDVAQIILSLNLAKFLKSTGSFFDELGKTIENFNGYIKNGAKNFKIVAEGILILVASLVVLAALKPDALKQAIVALAGVVALLAVMVKIAGQLNTSITGLKLNKTEGLSTTGTSSGVGAILAFAVSILVIAKAISELASGDVEPAKLWNAFAIVSATMAVMEGLLIAGNRFTKGRKKLTNVFGSDQGKGMILMAVSLFLIAKAFIQLGKLEPKEMKQGTIVMLSLFGAMAAMVAAAGITKGDVNFQPKAFLTISTSLAAIAFAISALGNIPVENLKAGYSALAIMAGAIGGIMIALKAAAKHFSGGTSFDKLAINFAIFSASMLAIAGSLALLKDFGGEDMTAGLAAMLLLVLEITGAMIALKAAGAKWNKGSSFDTIGKSFMELAASLVLIAAALRLLDGVENATRSLAILAASIIALLGAAALMKAAKLDVSVGMLGKSLQGLGIALLGFAAALLVITATLPLLGPELIAFIPFLALAIAEFFVALAGVVGAIGTFFAAIINEVKHLVPIMMDAIGLIVGGILQVFMGYIPQIAFALVYAIWKILDILDSFVGAIVETICNIIVHVLLGILDWLNKHQHDIWEIIKVAFLTIGNLIVSLIGDLLADVSQALFGWLFPTIGEDSRKLIKNLTDRVDKDIQVARDRINTSLEEGGLEIGDVLGAAVDKGVEDNKGTIQGAADKVLDFWQNPLKTASASGQFEALGFDLCGDLDTGMTSWLNSGKPEESANKVTKTLVQSLDGSFKMMVKEIDPMGNVTTYFEESGEALVKNAERIAIQTLNGFKVGISNKNVLDAIYREVDHLGFKTATRLENKLAVESPSKVTERIGKYFSEGLAIGIAKDSELAADSSEELGKTVISSLESPLSMIQQLIDSDFDIQPVVTPVVDLTNVQNGAGVVNELLSGYGTIGQVALNAQSLSVQPGQIQQGWAMTDALDKLNSRMNSIDESVEMLGALINGGLTSSVAQAVRSSLDGTAVVADKTQIGELVTNYQRTQQRRMGG